MNIFRNAKTRDMKSLCDWLLNCEVDATHINSWQFILSTNSLQITFMLGCFLCRQTLCCADLVYRDLMPQNLFVVHCLIFAVAVSICLFFSLNFLSCDKIWSDTVGIFILTKHFSSSDEAPSFWELATWHVYSQEWILYSQGCTLEKSGNKSKCSPLM